MGSQGINISDQFNRKYFFQEDPLTSLSVNFDPSQTATVYLRANIPLGATASSGVVTLKYRYGIFQEQKVLQAAIKLILVDMEIVDRDGDGGADLDLFPKPDYEVGDTINFIWTLKNNYPYETSGLKWSIELSGKTLIEGDVPPIGPGETMDFNESWKADLSTKYYNVATLRITGNAYTSEDKAPTASTYEKVYIDPGPGEPPYGLMILFGGIMTLVIAGFIAFYIWVRKDLEKKEAVERERYESVYGRKEMPALGGRTAPERRKARSLSGSDRPGLPTPSRLESEGKEPPGRKRSEKETSGKRIRDKGEQKTQRDNGRKKASSLGGLDKKREVTSPRKPADKHDREMSKNSNEGPKELEELEVLEEV
jgi:hypothetical protein